MELPQLGRRCAHEHCKQLDFLPLQCRCGKVFCSEHLNEHARSCEGSRVLSEDELKKFDNVFVCSKEGCKRKDVVPLPCPRCKRHFCIEHRHFDECVEKSAEEVQKEKEKYAEPIRKFNEAKAIVDKQVQDNISEAKKKPKNKEMAAKLQLMKIKNKATGLKQIPTSDRLYLNIKIPSQSQSVPVFISKTWSLGRAIDAVADECKLQNNNNKSSEKKLRLFKWEGQIVSQNLGVLMTNLLADKAIMDGEDLIIEYVDDNCVRLEI